MFTAAVAAAVLAVPGFSPVRVCEPIPELGWDTRVFEATEGGPFVQEVFLPETAWAENPADPLGGHYVSACFESATPHGRFVLLHRHPAAAGVRRAGRPVLLVGGAGDNAVRGLSYLAVSLSEAGFETYALTFAHNQGDNFGHAEHIARAIARMREETGAEKVHVVAWSKGGTAARIYASHDDAAAFEDVHPAYAASGTRYRGDVDHLVLVAAANAGQDVVFRWPAGNFYALGLLGTTPLNSPASWTTYYPNTSANPFTAMDVAARCITGDAFVGQAQLLADLRGLHPLPGGNPLLGVFANQPDYYTTYEGGLGFVSDSPGIEAAIRRGGGTIARLQALGVAPDVKLVLVAGGNPILPLTAVGTGTERLDGPWAELDAPARERTWDTLVADWLGAVFPWSAAFRHDLPRLYAGRAFLGEISGPSDGLVFLDSALDASGLTARGAEVVDEHTFEALSHPELVVAGQLAAAVLGDPVRAGVAFEPTLAAKYALPENQAVEWIIARLVAAEPVVPDPPADGGAVADGEPPADAGTGGDVSSGSGRDADGPSADAGPAASEVGPAGTPADDASGLDLAGRPDTRDAGGGGKRDLTGTSGGNDGCAAVPGHSGRGPAGFALLGLFSFMLRRRRSMSGDRSHVQQPEQHRRESRGRRIRQRWLALGDGRSPARPGMLRPLRHGLQYGSDRPGCRARFDSTPGDERTAGRCGEGRGAPPR